MESNVLSTVTVHALSAGRLTLPERFFVTPASATATRTAPSLAFLVQHTTSATPQKTTRLLFDLGLRRNPNTYPVPIRKHISTRQPMNTFPDVVASLAQGGLTPNDIDYVILSHVHWDHVGTPTDFTNPDTRFIVGHGSLDLLDGTNKISIGSHSHFERNLLPLERTLELSDVDDISSDKSDEGSESTTSSVDDFRVPPWQPLGDILPHTIDLFGDGSVHIVHAPGHLPGHINLLARVSPDKSVYLAGDACHDTRLFLGTHQIATWEDDVGRVCCIHVDKVKAEETIGRIKRLAQHGSGEGEVEVVFAHNTEWAEKAREDGRFWPGML
jgi:glyoxylase-like metal-dependent hydrolase (beta-lactamase superfamily II)